MTFEISGEDTTKKIVKPIKYFLQDRLPQSLSGPDMLAQIPSQEHTIFI